MAMVASGSADRFDAVRRQRHGDPRRRRVAADFQGIGHTQTGDSGWLTPLRWSAVNPCWAGKFAKFLARANSVNVSAWWRRRVRRPANSRLSAALRLSLRA